MWQPDHARRSERLHGLPFSEPLAPTAEFIGFLAPSSSDVQNSPTRQEWKPLTSVSGRRQIAMLSLKQPTGRSRDKTEVHWMTGMRRRAAGILNGTARVNWGERVLVKSLDPTASLPALIEPVHVPLVDAEPVLPALIEPVHVPVLPALIEPVHIPLVDAEPVEEKARQPTSSKSSINGHPLIIIHDWEDEGATPDVPDMLVALFNRIWAAALLEKIDPLNNTGKVRASDVVIKKHGRLACKYLGWDKGDGTLPPCGAVHGGWCAMAGSTPQQMMRFRDTDRNETMAPFLWKVEKALTNHDAACHNAIAKLQYFVECLLLKHLPEVWLRQYSVFEDLSSKQPSVGRLYQTGAHNQWVMNRNLVLGVHRDHFNCLRAAESLIIIERGPTGIEFTIHADDAAPFVIRPNQEGTGARMTTLLAELHSIDHAAHVQADVPEGQWQDRWSFSFYVNAASLSSCLKHSATFGTGREAPSESPNFAPCFVGRGLPEHAAHLCALQPGGWLACRYGQGPPWPALSEVLGMPMIPTVQEPIGNTHAKRVSTKQQHVTCAETRSALKRTRSGMVS